MIFTHKEVCPHLQSPLGKWSSASAVLSPENSISLSGLCAKGQTLT